MNPTIDLLHRHRSIRAYLAEPVDPADIRTAVAAGQAAATSSAVQAYCIVHVTDATARERIAELAGGQQHVRRAGAFFVVCADTRRHRLLAARAGRPYDAMLEAFLQAVIDAALFSQNVAVAFESLGYGICYIGGLRNGLAALDELLELPEGVYPLFGLCVGRPDEAPLPRPRLPLDAVLLSDRYPSDDAMLARLDSYDAAYRAYLAERGADERPWSDAMIDKFAAVRRPEAGAFYRGKGANID